MKNTNKLKYIIYSVIAIIGITVDQIVKAWAYNELRPVGSIPLIEGVFHFTYRENTGAAFSFLEGNNVFFIILTSCVILLLLFLIISGRITNRFAEYCVLFIAMGGIGNLIDRFNYEFVVDMFDFTLINFAVFNVADIFVTCGSILFIIIFLFTKGEVVDLESRKKKPVEEASVTENED
ncbi:MAG: signal peptidase II [Clostridia bacterium]|nr:signal peptidase II [Clostridia bacterium]